MRKLKNVCLQGARFGMKRETKEFRVKRSTDKSWVTKLCTLYFATNQLRFAESKSATNQMIESEMFLLDAYH